MGWRKQSIGHRPLPEHNGLKFGKDLRSSFIWKNLHRSVIEPSELLNWLQEHLKPLVSEKRLSDLCEELGITGRLAGVR